MPLLPHFEPNNLHEHVICIDMHAALLFQNPPVIPGVWRCLEPPKLALPQEMACLGGSFIPTLKFGVTAMYKGPGDSASPRDYNDVNF